MDNITDYKDGSNRPRPTKANYEGETVWDFIERCFNEGKFQYDNGKVYKAYDFRGKGSWLEARVEIGNLTSKGYKAYTLRFNGRSYRILIHRMVYVAFYGGNSLKSDLVINHKNGNKIDNRIENLELISQKENIQHSWRTGLMCNERHGNSKLTWKKVREIREKYAKGTHTQVELAKEYKVRQTTISKVVKGDSWVGEGRVI